MVGTSRANCVTPRRPATTSHKTGDKGRIGLPPPFGESLRGARPAESRDRRDVKWRLSQPRARVGALASKQTPFGSFLT